MRGATVLFVHGGNSTGGFWDRVVPLVEAPTLAPDLPGRRGRTGDLMTLTLDDSAGALLADLDAAAPDGAVVVVAHSSGGLLVPRVADALGERLAHVLLSSASVPPDGGTGLDCMKPRHREGVLAAVEWARSSGERVVTPRPEDPEALREAYGERLDDEALAFVCDAERLVEDSFNVYFQPVHWSTVAAPVTYLRAGLDRAVPPALQDEMIARLPGEPNVVRWDCGHVPAVTRPAALADLVNDIVD